MCYIYVRIGSSYRQSQSELKLKILLKLIENINS